MNDPYKTLGVSRDASDDEIKKAYRELARKYHPDNYVNNPLADLCEEKMKEVNEAYDTIQKQRQGGRTESDGGSAGTSGGTYSGAFSQIRRLIHAGQFAEADMILDSVSQSDRNAEWNFLKGCVLTQRGWYFDAQKYYETACYMDPDNAEYRNALNNIRSSASTYGRGYRTDVNQGGAGACDICSGLICADLCCNCMGGDCLRCC